MLYLIVNNKAFSLFAVRFFRCCGLLWLARAAPHRTISPLTKPHRTFDCNEIDTHQNSRGQVDHVCYGPGTVRFGLDRYTENTGGDQQVKE